MNDQPAPVRYAVIDSETGGLFDFSKPADAEGQPRLAALCMILLNADLSVNEEYSALVKPDGWAMSPEVTAINGLTTERLMAEGKPIAEVLSVYSQAIQEGYVIVSFNCQFDSKIMRGELRRAGMPDLFEQTPNVCVMRASKGVIPRPDGKSSWPKLEHVRLHLGLDNDGAHTAVGDARAALALLRHLIAAGVELKPDVHYAKSKPVPMSDVPIGGDNSDAPISRPRGVASAANQELPE